MNRLLRYTQLRTFSEVDSSSGLPFLTDVLWKNSAPEGLLCILNVSTSTL